MIPLLLSVLSSSLIFVLFKLFDRFDIHTLTAIIANYITAFLIGVLLYHSEWHPDNLSELEWLPWTLLSGVMFISLFFVMARSTSVNGVSTTSVAVKMSMAVALIFMIVGYKEPLSLIKSAGILIAFLAVYMVSSNPEKTKSSAPWMLITLFFGSGILEFMLNYVQNYSLGTLSKSLFTAFGLGTAGIFGLLYLTFSKSSRPPSLSLKSILAGALLGIPNYFSIYCLLLAYQTTGWQDSTVVTIVGVSVVLLSSLIGLLLFKEALQRKKVLGLVFAILAILLLYFSN